MADFTSHLLNGNQITSQIKQGEIKRIIEENKFAFNVGLQGPDILFYHNITKGGSPLNKVGGKMHKTNVNEMIKFMQQTINKIKVDKKAKNKNDDKVNGNDNKNVDINQTNFNEKDCLTSYLFGFICHYNLDKYLHPYVGYFVDESLKAQAAKKGIEFKRFESKENNAKYKLKSNAHFHSKLESEIDSAMHKLYVNKSIHKFKIDEHYDLSKNENANKAIAKLYTLMLKKVFNVDATETEIEDATTSTIKLNEMFYKGFYVFLSKFMKPFIKNDSFLTHFKNNASFDPTTVQPYENVNSGEKFNESLEQVFRKAEVDSLADVEMIYEAIQNEIPMDINGKLSFENGL
jgi:hypothetical protein